MDDQITASRPPLTSRRNRRRRPALHRACVETLESRRLLTTYSVDLGTLGGESSSASDINASGQIVGTSFLADGSQRAFIWQSGVMTDLGTLGGPANYSWANGINDAGQVVGQSATSASVVAAFLVTPEDTDGNGKPDRWYRDTNSDGKNDLMRDLGTIGGNYVYAIANDVNNLGQVVGTTSTSGPSGSTYRAFRWQNGVMTDMGTFGGASGSSSFANAINDAGQITGAAGGGPFLWKAGVVTLGVGGNDINASGQIVGSSDGYFERMWTPTVPNGTSGTFTTLEQLPPVDPTFPGYGIGITNFAHSINGAGQVVGTQDEIYYGENANGYVSRGVRWINGVPQALPLNTATAINDAGHIVGSRGGRGILLANENFAMPLITISGTTVTEGHAGTTSAVFTVSLSKTSTQSVTVQYATADGDATAGDDYLAASGMLTFAPGQTSRTISVAVLGDRIADYDVNTLSEAFTVALSNPTSALLAGDPASGVIRDDEPRVSGATTTVLEGNTGSKNALVTVNLSSAYDQPVTVTYETGDQGPTPTPGVDYIATSGTVTFAPGQTSKQIAVSILGDRVAEPSGESIYVFLNPGLNAGFTRNAFVQIQDDEPSVTLTPYVEVSEPASGTINALLTVSLWPAYDQDVIVEYSTYDGDGWYAAFAPSDYVATAGSVTIQAGQISRTITVPVIGDGVVEQTEYFYVALTGVTGNAFIPWNDGWGELASLGIRDYDPRVKTWVGPASGGSWSTAANWSPSGVPGAGDQVTIAGKSVTLAAGATVAGLDLTGGATLSVAANGNRVLRTSNLNIDGTSKLNLNDNDLIIDYSGDISASPIGSRNGAGYTGVTGMIARGYTYGDWSGTGLVTTTQQARTGVTTLAVAEAARLFDLSGNATAMFAGQTVDGTAVLVKYTYTGDLNLDGTLDGADYGIIDNYVQLPGTNRYENGDFNFDGVIDGADYGLIDNAIQLQGVPL